ncbi:GspE/PulE family protein [Serpentinicella sp. ANB-PHB4]|uniref:GspE/PulE family protein n=1 Tax=Serpentinicella sp. ANB-PHB4 TaxID=3074076 RepID=UPI002854800B|nr:GspE/PulE family protein [Serpentinicella sp. ANB-PHB4]MDR5658120.1 GspE/PulE family protein [Serpentinicella sp. ANB-PHB4]
MNNSKRKRLGDLLIEAGHITTEQLYHVLHLQKVTGKKLGEILVDENFVTEKQVVETLERQLGFIYVDLNQTFIDPEIPILIDEKLAKRYFLIAIDRKDNQLTVAMTDPLNIFALDDIKIATGFDVEPVIATKQEILSAINQYYEKDTAEDAFKEFKQSFDINEEDIDDETLSEVNNAPIVRIVNSLIKQGVKMRASDIHIEPFEDHVKVRVRIDGDLQEIMKPEKSTHSAIATRIKIMGKMDIAEKRIPQDGRIETHVEDKPIDLRISVLPTVHGEKIVIRISDRENFNMTKEQLGFTDHNLKLFDHIIKNPNGIILVTGPTGSGKSTTLYTTLQEISTPDKNIVTVEDPVENQINGINQVQVNNKAGMTFANALRSILRQDPDIIMIGEIRDAETAQIAVKASITGHLVLSTMHTNDTASTVTRLVDMGLESYLVSSSLVGVVAQRLVKRICEKCKISFQADPLQKELLYKQADETVTLHKGTGCRHCNETGYKGRIAIHEVMAINKDLRILIDKEATIDEIRDAAVNQGMITLKQNCVQLALQGITTTDEVIRVAYSLD